MKHLFKRLYCSLFGHKWVTYFNPAKDLDGNTYKRMYCERWGIVKHTIVKPEYKEPVKATPGREKSPITRIK